MNPRSVLVVSLSLNMLLMSAWIVLFGRRDTPQKADVSDLANLLKTTVVMNQKPPETPAVVNFSFTWRTIESKDYDRYLANLRAIECPEWLIRDILVADIDEFYKCKYPSISARVPPWDLAGQRSEARLSAQKIYDLEIEKRGLVKKLLGYEWDNEDNKIWDQDLTTSLLLGFLPVEKEAKVMAVADKYSDAASWVHEEANEIIIDEDRAQLRALYDALVNEIIPLLDPTEMDELQLRIQAKMYFEINDIHFDDVSLTDNEIREIARFSKNVDDAAAETFTAARPFSEEEREQRQLAFENQIKGFLGSSRFCDYQMGQDYDFRDAFEFTSKNHLSREMAVKIYDVRKAAEDQVGKVMIDKSLSLGEKTEILTGLKDVAANAVSSLLGNSYSEYVAGRGWWLENLSDQPKN